MNKKILYKQIFPILVSLTLCVGVRGAYENSDGLNIDPRSLDNTNNIKLGDSLSNFIRNNDEIEIIKKENSNLKNELINLSNDFNTSEKNPKNKIKSLEEINKEKNNNTTIQDLKKELIIVKNENNDEIVKLKNSINNNKVIINQIEIKLKKKLHLRPEGQ